MEIFDVLLRDQPIRINAYGTRHETLVNDKSSYLVKGNAYLHRFIFARRVIDHALATCYLNPFHKILHIAFAALESIHLRLVDGRAYHLSCEAFNT